MSHVNNTRKGAGLSLAITEERALKTTSDILARRDITELGSQDDGMEGEDIYESSSEDEGMEGGDIYESG